MGPAILMAFVFGATVEAPALSGAWQNAPARFAVEGSVRTAYVTDAAQPAGPESGKPIPCKVQQLGDKRYVFWTRTDDGSKSCRYDIAFNEEPPFPPPVFVGAGDMLDYGRKNVISDLGVGLWATAMPIDWDGDGNVDLLYSCQDLPQGGLYLYLQVRAGIFEQAQRLGDGIWYPALADMNGDGRVDVLAGDAWYDDVRANGTSKRVEGPLKHPEQRLRRFMARQVDWDGDGVLDLVSAGDDWNGYGWDCAFDETGNWTHGPLHGPVWFHKNTGANEAPAYADAVRTGSDDTPIDTYGAPCPCFADWDGDGDLDLICGEFRDGFTYFENIGSATNPRLGAGRPVTTTRGPLRADLCMISPTPYDWDGDGRPDLVVGQEDGRVYVFQNQGVSQESPRFAEGRFLHEVNAPLKSGVLVTPWLDDASAAAHGDLYCGNTAGYVEVFPWRRGEFQNGRNLRTDKGPFRIQAGYNGSVQGPAERKWGYISLSIGDLNNDNVAEIVYNSIIGRVESMDRLDPNGLVSNPEPVEVAWEATPPYPAWNWWKPGPTDLVVEWRTRPLVLDWDGDGVNDLVAVDHEGFLALYRGSDGRLLPGQRVFLNPDKTPLRLNDGKGGKSGRLNIHLVDWDNDGDLDLIRNTETAGWYENTSGRVALPRDQAAERELGLTTRATFVSRGDFPGRRLAGHSTAPFAADWNGDGKLDLLLGAEDGHIYCYHRAALDEPDKMDAKPVQ